MGLQRRAGPYEPETQLLGGRPSVVPDVPISAVLLFLFLVTGISSFVIFIRNKKNNHKFVVNGALFGFSKIRICTFSLRMAWALHPTSIELGIASSVFVYAGTIILFGINLIFAQRIVRAQHPVFGWSRGFKLAFILLFAITILTLIAIIVAVLQTFFTLDIRTHEIDRDIQLYGLTCFSAIAFLPSVTVLISTLTGMLPSVRRKRMAEPTDKFGEGSMRTKIWICVAASLILTLGAAFRTGANFAPPTPNLGIDPPGPDVPLPVPTPWYLSKASFYAFNFATELIVIGLWLISRVDKSFYVPDKADGVYHPHPAPRQYPHEIGLSKTWSVQAFHDLAQDKEEALIPQSSNEKDLDMSQFQFDTLDLVFEEPDDVVSSRNSVMTSSTKETRRTRGSWQVEGPHQVLRFV
ncbi:La-related protein 1 [Sphaceloma murrayae]|uniref:La-related protein 1 n=1 Tax=Sphaceloma murrayae TaxID=2082308 RepID=A0A2K1QUV6_9PEZI|nr:La-related protein 1 [Sphaceloma murrayae]